MLCKLSYVFPWFLFFSFFWVIEYNFLGSLLTIYFSSRTWLKVWFAILIEKISFFILSFSITYFSGYVLPLLVLLVSYFSFCLPIGGRCAIKCVFYPSVCWILKWISYKSLIWLKWLLLRLVVVFFYVPSS